MTHSQALWTSFLGGLPHLRRVCLSFCWENGDVWRQHRVPHVLALLMAAEAAVRKLHVQLITSAIRCVALVRPLL